MVNWPYAKYEDAEVSLGSDDANNAMATTNVAPNADGSVFERLEWIQAAVSGAVGLASFPAAAAPANDVSLAEVLRAIYNLSVPTVATGEADVDVSEADYTTVGGIAFLTITPAAGAPLADVYVDLDLLKATTGLLVVNTTETVQIMLQVKIDGTNWRTVKHWPAASSTTGLAVPDAAQDLDALDDSPGHRFYVGDIGVSQEARLTVELSAETGGDAEIPYAVYYKGLSAPTITAVAAA